MKGIKWLKEKIFRVFAPVLALAVGLSLAACGAQAGDESESIQTQEEADEDTESIQTEEAYEETEDSAQEDTEDPAQDDTEGSSGSEDSSWAQTYLEYFADAETSSDDMGTYYEINGGSYTQFACIYVNDDDIPEIVLYGDSEATGCLILTISESGEIEELQTDRLGFYYMEGENVLNNSAGNMGEYYDSLYTINSEGEWEILAEGGYTGEDEDDMTYYWEGIEVSKEEYEMCLEEYINSDTQKNGESSEYGGDVDYMSLEELCSCLEEAE